MSKTNNTAANSSSHRLAQSNDVQRFSDIEVPDALRTSLKTGWEYIDALFTGSGIRPSTCCMVTGLPGAGKTTISLQLADSLIGEGHTVFYNSCEAGRPAPSRAFSIVCNESTNMKKPLPGATF